MTVYCHSVKYRARSVSSVHFVVLGRKSRESQVSFSRTLSSALSSALSIIHEMVARYLSLLFVCFQLRFVFAFMPNHVFSFNPDDPNRMLDVDVEPPFTANDFYPVENAEGLVDDGSHTHKDIIRRACLEEVALFYEETLKKPKGSLQGTNPLTAETLLDAVVGRKTSSLNFEFALREIEVQATLMDVWYAVNNDIDQATAMARQHFDDEKIKGGHDYLLETAQAVFTSLSAQSYSAARTFVGRYLLTLQDFYSHSNWIELENTDILEDLGKVKQAPFLNNIAGNVDRYTPRVHFGSLLMNLSC